MAASELETDIRPLNAVATISVEEGLPLAWIPRTEIVLALINRKNAEDRLRVLSSRFDDILDDCEIALIDVSHEWATQCRAAINVLRQAGYEGPAQSHAGNIIDSIVLAIHGSKGRDAAVEIAEEAYEELPLSLAVENLVLRPLILGFARWYVNTGDPIPASFARHVTAHAVGRPGVFTRLNGLIAVMLATSLTIHFWDHPAAP